MRVSGREGVSRHWTSDGFARRINAWMRSHSKKRMMEFPWDSLGRCCCVVMLFGASKWMWVLRVIIGTRSNHVIAY